MSVIPSAGVEDYVVHYSSEGQGGTPDITITEYYDRFCLDLTPDSARFPFRTHNSTICLFHSESDPSLGLIRPKNRAGIEKFHCFGCGVAGKVTDFHRFVQSNYYNRTITNYEAAIELADLWGIDLSDFDNNEAEDYLTTQLRKMYKAVDTYTTQDFSEEVLKVRRHFAELNRVPTPEVVTYLNSACVKLIATDKQLYT